jgi:hypothetical protein
MAPESNPFCNSGFGRASINMTYIFILSKLGVVTPKILASKLKSFGNVGRVVYKHCTEDPFIQGFVNSTIIQVIASRIVA